MTTYEFITLKERLNKAVKASPYISTLYMYPEGFLWVGTEAYESINRLVVSPGLLAERKKAKNIQLELRKEFFADLGVPFTVSSTTGFQDDHLIIPKGFLLAMKGEYHHHDDV